MSQEVENRLKALEDRLDLLFEFLEADAIDGADDPEVVGSFAEDIKELTELPFFEVLPAVIAADIDITPGILEAQRCAVAFLADPDREDEDLTAGEFWWCIMRAYTVLSNQPEYTRHVGKNPSGLREAIYLFQFLLPLKEMAYYHAWYHGQMGQPKTPVPTGPIEWPDWLPDPRRV